MKHFVDTLGRYIGGFADAEPPAGAIEVPFAPEDARQVWDRSAWSAAPPARRTVAKSVVMIRITEKGKMAQAYAMLTANPENFAKWFAPDRSVVYCDDPEAVAVVRALDLDPAVILAPN